MLRLCVLRAHLQLVKAWCLSTLAVAIALYELDGHREGLGSCSTVYYDLEIGKTGGSSPITIALPSTK